LSDMLNQKEQILTLQIRPSRQPIDTNSLTSPKSKKKKRKLGVRFDSSLITGVSRPPSSLEHWTLYYFETHAITCQACKSGLRSSKMAGDLCERGSELAQEVVSLKLSMGPEEIIYAQREAESPTTKSSTRKKNKGLQVRVEIPFNYKYSRRLLKSLANNDDLLFGNGLTISTSDPPKRNPEPARRNSSYLVHEPSQPSKKSKNSYKKKITKSSRGRTFYPENLALDVAGPYDSYQPNWDAQLYFSPILPRTNGYDD